MNWRKGTVWEDYEVDIEGAVCLLDDVICSIDEFLKEWPQHCDEEAKDRIENIWRADLVTASKKLTRYMI